MNMPERWVLPFLWILFPLLCHSQGPFAGPFRIVLNQVHRCEDPGTNQVYLTSTRINRVSRNKYVYSTNLTTTDLVIDDNMTMEWDLATWGNGGWRPHFLQADFPKFCSSVKSILPQIFGTLQEMFHKDDCPIPAGTYELPGFDLNDLKLSDVFPSFPYGKYRGDVIEKLNDTIVGCIRFIFDTVPLKRTRPRSKPQH